MSDQEPVVDPKPSPSRRTAAKGGKRPGSRKIRQLVIECARLLADRRCEDVLALDLQGVSDVFDFLVIGTGTSERQMRSVGSEVEDLLRQAGLERFGGETDASTTWIALDFLDIGVHLFSAEARGHYDLEMLWGDAPRIRWRRKAAKAGDDAEAAPTDEQDEA